MHWKFEDPAFLVLLLAIPLLLFLHLRYEKRRRLLYPAGVLKSVQVQGWRVRFRHIVRALYFASLSLGVFALARPQAGTVHHEVITTGVDMMLVLDASGSMKALDFSEGQRRKTRFQVAKDVIADFIDKREGDRIGLVVFGEYAFTQCPLTVDYALLKGFLETLEVGIAGDSTALGDALALAVKRLRKLKSKSKIIVALTDGRNNAGQLSPEEAADIARSYHIRIYTVGIGVEGRSPFRVETLFGPRIVYQRVQLDEKTLRAVANATGGRYFRASSPRELEEVYDTIDRLEKTERKMRSWAEYREEYRFFLLPAFLMAVGAFLLSHSALRRMP